MTLLQKQFLFARLVPRLIDKAHELGYEVTLGDAFRDPRVHGAMGIKLGYGHPKSGHKLRLAEDLNLFRLVAGKWELVTDTEGHRQLGEWWEQQHPLCSWGGRFQDGNHYSLEHNGVK